MRPAGIATGLLALSCGSAAAPPIVGTPVPGEGEECPLGSTTACRATESCVSFTAYDSPTGVCQTNCSAGCSGGESCGPDAGTCQCTPTLTKGTPGDPCADAGLICHPDFRVCLPTEPTGTTCPSGEVYSPAWTLCVVE